eukprot:15853-Heterococcus_DN1.PRE.2
MMLRVLVCIACLCLQLAYAWLAPISALGSTQKAHHRVSHVLRGIHAPHLRASRVHHRHNDAAVCMKSAADDQAPDGNGNERGWLSKVKSTVLLLWAKLIVSLRLRRKGGRSNAASLQQQWSGLFRQKPKKQVLTLQQKLRALSRRRSTWLLTAALTLSMKLLISTSRTVKRAAKPVELPMSQFLQIISSSQRQDLSALLITNSGKMLYKLADKACVTRPVAVSQSVMETLLRNGIEFGAAASESMTPAILLAQLFPLLWLALMIGLMRRQVGGGVGSAGRQADLTTLDRSLTFDDVAGIDEAKSEVRELVQILRNPQPYVAAGARLPSGVLLVGGPGTGKTLLARVMAAEAGVPLV